MPGPGGGGHGGGGGRGGSFGGGGGRTGGGFHGGGSFHGGHHRPHGGWGMPMGGWGWGRRHYGGGGCLGGLSSILFIPIFVIILFIFSLFGMFDNGVDVVINNGYDEEVFQDFAYDQYFEQFADSTATEDNLLIVFLTTEEHYDFYYIAMVGDHIAKDINYLLGNNNTALGQAMNSCINETNYKYSLDSNLADVMQTMTETVTALALENSYDCSEDHLQVASRLVNNTDIPMTDSTVNHALEAFTDATGIPVVILVEDAQDVFGSEATTVGGGGNVRVSTIACVILIAVVVIVVIAVSRKKGKNDNSGKDSRYSDFDDQY